MRATFPLVVFVFLMAVLISSLAVSQNAKTSGETAFVYKITDFEVGQVVKMIRNSAQLPLEYEAQINLAVCDDKLCANVALKLSWDLAGNYTGFDTIPGKPLTKFDHKRFSDSDYKKLDQILKDKNSSLRILEKEDLIDRSVQVKSKTVDAVTGATPATIKNSVVEGAVYTTYSLWHLVNGSIRNRMAQFTQTVFSDELAVSILNSSNYETQLFALRFMSEADFSRQAEMLFQVIGRSTPLIRAYIIGKLPLPFPEAERNQAFISLFPDLDAYSKSVFLNRLTAEQKPAQVLLPLIKSQFRYMDEKQLVLVGSAMKKYNIPGYSGHKAE